MLGPTTDRVMIYRCYFILDGHIWCGENFSAADDADAIAKARRRLPDSGLTSIEVWDGMRLAGSVPGKNAAPPLRGR
jgi:hypothetical protein